MEMIGGEWGNQRITTYLQALFPSAATTEYLA